MTRRNQLRHRRGAMAVLMSLLLIPMLALVALCVDYGYLLNVKTDMQRIADAAALAAVRDLVPTPDGTQNLDAVRAAIRQYVNYNVTGGLTVLDADIEVGRYDPETIYSGVTLLNNGTLDTVRVTLRRDSTANSPVSLFFARVMGITQASVSVTATAVLQKARDLPPGADILPIAVPQSTWTSHPTGHTWSIYGDGRVVDGSGSTVPGNWGTVDIGPTSNSTSNLTDQIMRGLAQSELDVMYSQGRIDSPAKIGGTEQFWSQADTGLSAGLKGAIELNHGKTKLVPIVDQNTGASGNNLEYHVVGWGVVKLVDSKFTGGDSQRYVRVQKAYMYDQDLAPNPDLSGGATIPAAFTSPVLVQ